MTGTSVAELLRTLPALVEILEDLNVRHVTVAANGTWSFEKLGRTRSGGASLARATVDAIAALVPNGRPLRHGEWAIRRYDGVNGPSLLIERLPVAIADRLSQDILTALKKQVRRNGNGVLLGQPGCGKAALLLWLALQIPDEPVLYVSENPPSEFPGSHIVHVFPPTTAGERRSLERFVRLSPTVMWDRVANHDDLLTLFGFHGARRRWFSLDAASVESGLDVLAGASQLGCDARVSALLALATSVIGRPEARNLVLRDGDTWREAFRAGASCLASIEAYDSRELRRLERLEVAPGGADSQPAIEPEAVDERRESGGPVTIPVEMEEEEEEEAAARPDDAITGMIAREEMRELRELGILPPDAPGRAVVADRHGVSGGIPEKTRAYLDAPSEIGLPETTASIIRSIMPSLDGDEDPPPPAVNLADLRITTAGEVDESQLLVADDSDEPQLGDDYSGVFEGDLDLDSLGDEMLSEISEEVSTSVASERHFVPFGTTNPDQPIYLSEDDIEPLEESGDQTLLARGDVVLLAQEMRKQGAVEDEAESTREFTLNERLLMLRKRRGQDD